MRRLTIQYRDLGKMPYQKAWDLQERLLKANVDLKIAAGRSTKAGEVDTQSYLLFCEHPHVYTLGKSGKVEHLLLDDASIAKKGISFFKINRGGDITYHGPGQITGYPIFDLEKLKPDLGWYLRTLEEVMIGLLAEYGLKGDRIKGATGVWLGINTHNPRKICAFGVRCSRWISMHGFALNVNTDLSYFNHIIPCGINDKGVTSLQVELGRAIDVKEVKEGLKRHFVLQFGLEYEGMERSSTV